MKNPQRPGQVGRTRGLRRGGAAAVLVAGLACMALNLDAQPSARRPETPSTPASQPSGAGKITIGAIRWDAWFDDEVNPYERNLDARQWHGRLPFYARIVSDNRVEVHGDSQEVVDQEIAFAKAGGIDYWAFLYYPANQPGKGFKLDLMNRARRLYLSSKHRADIDFCLIVYPDGHAGKATIEQQMDEWVRLVQEPTYHKVAGGRPLVYVMAWGAEGTVEKMFGSARAARARIDAFRERVVRSGHRNPYLVGLSVQPGEAVAAMAAMNLDAISSYATFGGKDYAGLAAAHRRHWEAMKATGKPVVPNLTAGWGGPRDGLGDAKQPTPGELARHLREGLAWVRANPGPAEARTVLFYAWNEVDEGGWLVPDKRSRTAKLEAIREVVRETVPASQPAGR